MQANTISCELRKDIERDDDDNDVDDADGDDDFILALRKLKNSLYKSTLTQMDKIYFSCSRVQTDTIKLS